MKFLNNVLQPTKKKTMDISHFGSILKKYVKQNAFLVWAKKQELKTFGWERKA